MAETLQRHDRNRIDQDPLRRRSCLKPLTYYCGYLRHRQRHRIPLLRIQGHRQVRFGIPSAHCLRSRISDCTSADKRQPLRPDPDGCHNILPGERWYVQRSHNRGDTVWHTHQLINSRRDHRHQAYFFRCPQRSDPRWGSWGFFWQASSLPL